MDVISVRLGKVSRLQIKLRGLSTNIRYQKEVREGVIRLLVGILSGLSQSLVDFQTKDYKVFTWS